MVNNIKGASVKNRSRHDLPKGKKMLKIKSSTTRVIATSFANKAQKYPADDKRRKENFFVFIKYK